MSLLRHSSLHTRRRLGGFSLIELMIGVLIGLLSTVVIGVMLSKTEGQKRSTTSGTDAQINGSIAIYELERYIRSAGYGLVENQLAVGCPLTVQFGGTAVAGAPTVLAPVVITPGANGAPDSIRILSSSASGTAVSTEVIAPAYNPTGPVSARNTVSVSSAVGFNTNDLAAIFFPGTPASCQVFQVTGTTPAPAAAVLRADNATWNATGFPNQAATLLASPAVPPAPPVVSFLMNLGSMDDRTFSIVGSDFRLRMTPFNLSTQSTGPVQDLQTNIVALRAFYGIDNTGAAPGGAPVNQYTTVTPTTNAGWLQVRSVRIGLLARSAQYEKDEVTQSNPLWDVGTAVPVDGSISCGSSNCIALNAQVSTDWKHYRYKVFDVVIPIRNQLWKST